MKQEKIIKMAASITVNELAEALGTSVANLIQELFKNGIMATINQKLDFDTVSIVLEELGYDNVKLEQIDIKKENVMARHQNSDKALARPPIVAVMGHVDHGKTTLLDYILKNKTAEGEAGGITQYISAYQTNHNKQIITLLDTPGHEAFTAIRQHGAVLTDIVVIVVAADDGVKPQTVEAIKFAKDANAKIIVAITKVDKPTANVEMVKGQLASEHNLNPEEWSGDTIFVPVSGLTGEGVDKLLDNILLVAEMEEYKADYDSISQGLVIEARTEKGKGSVVRLLVEHGELKVGDYIVAGESYAKVRTMLDFDNKPLRKAGPSTPVTITGFKKLPAFGELFQEVKNERSARTLSSQNHQLMMQNAASSNVTGLDLLNKIHQNATAKKLNIIVKADVQGSLASVIDSIKMIDTKGEIEVNIVHQSIGDISENDIKMAVGESTVLYGFNVNLRSSLKKMAGQLGVEIKNYKIIYELIEDCYDRLEALLEPEIKETTVGKLKVKGVFKITKTQAVVGGLVTEGKIVPDLWVRVKRRKEQLAEAKLTNLQKHKDDVKELIEGDMCGLSLATDRKIAIEIDDKLEFFKREVIARKLK